MGASRNFPIDDELLKEKDGISVVIAPSNAELQKPTGALPIFNLPAALALFKVDQFDEVLLDAYQMKAKYLNNLMKSDEITFTHLSQLFDPTYRFSLEPIRATSFQKVDELRKDLKEQQDALSKGMTVLENAQQEAVTNFTSNLEESFQAYHVRTSRLTYIKQSIVWLLQQTALACERKFKLKSADFNPVFAGIADNHSERALNFVAGLTEKSIHELERLREQMMEKARQFPEISNYIFGMWMVLHKELAKDAKYDLYISTENKGFTLNPAVIIHEEAEWEDLVEKPCLLEKAASASLAELSLQLKELKKSHAVILQRSAAAIDLIAPIIEALHTQADALNRNTKTELQKAAALYEKTAASFEETAKECGFLFVRNNDPSSENLSLAQNCYQQIMEDFPYAIPTHLFNLTSSKQKYNAMKAISSRMSDDDKRLSEKINEVKSNKLKMCKASAALSEMAGEKETARITGVNKALESACELLLERYQKIQALQRDIIAMTEKAHRERMEKINAMFSAVSVTIAASCEAGRRNEEKIANVRRAIQDGMRVVVRKQAEKDDLDKIKGALQEISEILASNRVQIENLQKLQSEQLASLEDHKQTVQAFVLEIEESKINALATRYFPLEEEQINVLAQGILHLQSIFNHLFDAAAIIRAELFASRIRLITDEVVENADNVNTLYDSFKARLTMKNKEVAFQHIKEDCQKLKPSRDKIQAHLNALENEYKLVKAELPLHAQEEIDLAFSKARALQEDAERKYQEIENCMTLHSEMTTVCNVLHKLRDLVNTVETHSLSASSKNLEPAWLSIGGKVGKILTDTPNAIAMLQCTEDGYSSKVKAAINEMAIAARLEIEATQPAGFFGFSALFTSAACQIPSDTRQLYEVVASFREGEVTEAHYAALQKIKPPMERGKLLGKS